VSTNLEESVLQQKVRFVKAKLLVKIDEAVIKKVTAYED